ncbi:MAG: hypothetical protein JSW33_08045 [bacterium]|nr:MAG: hypothetical protein JSW33_08045 [bacterium]
MFKFNNYMYIWLFIMLFNLSAFAQAESSAIKNLSQKADVIVTGKVTEKESSWNASKTRIYTKTTIQVDEYLKGTSNENTVQITSRGGEVGDVGELYTHMPRFDNDEEVLVFLKRDGSSTEYKVLNGEEGKISVIEDPNTREKVTHSSVRVKDLKSQIRNYVKDQQ